MKQVVDQSLYAGIFDKPQLQDEITAPVNTQNARGSAITLGAPAALAAMVDTFGTSTGLLDDGQVAATLKNIAPEVGDYFEQHRQGVGIAGDVAGLFIPGILATRAISGTGALFKFARYGGKAFGRGKNVIARANAIYQPQGFKDKLLTSIFTSGQNTGSKLTALGARARYDAGRTGQFNWGKNSDNAEWVQEVRDLKVGAIVDTVKENAAFELGVWAAMSDSEALYPAEFTALDHLMWNVPLPAAAAGIESLYIARQIAHISEDAGRTGIRFLQNNFIDPTLAVSQPGQRDIAATVSIVNHKTLKDLSEKHFDTFKINSTDEKLAHTERGAQQRFKDNLEAAAIAVENEYKHDIKNLFGDSAIEGLTISTKIDMAEPSGAFNTMVEAGRNNPFVLPGAVSAEAVPTHGFASASLDSKRTRRVNKLTDEVLELQEKKKLEAGLTEAEQQKLTYATTELRKVEEATFLTFEADGTISLAAERSPIAQDSLSVVDVHTRKGSKLGGDSHWLTIPQATERGGKQKRVVGVDDNGQFLIPENSMVNEGKTVFAGKDVTMLLSESPYAKAERTSLVMQDLLTGYAYDKKGGLLETEVLDHLSPGDRQIVLDVLRNQQGTTRSIQALADSGDPKYQMVFNAFEPWRKRMRELAGDSGVIALVRGEGRKANAQVAGTHDIASYTIRPATGEAFGNQTIVKYVSPEDMIMPVKSGRHSEEWEIVVKGNQSRKAKSADDIMVNQDPFGRRANFQALDLFQRTGLYLAGEKMINTFVENIAKGSGTVKSIYLDPADNHFHADMILELSRRLSEDQFRQAVRMPADTTMDKVALFSLARKYEEWSLWQDVQRGIKAGVLDKDMHMTATDFNRIANMPMSNPGEVHPLVDLFRMLKETGEVDLLASMKNMDDVQRVLQDSTFFPEIIPYLDQAQRIDGKMFSMNSAKFKPSNVVYRKPVDGELRNKGGVRDLAAAQQIKLQDQLTTAGTQFGAEIVQIVTDSIRGTGPENAAKDLASLGNGSQRGGAAGHLLYTRGMSGGQSRAIRGMDIISNNTERLGTDLINKIFTETGYVDVANALQAKENSVALQRVAELTHVRRQGWDVETELVEVSGGWGFKLKDNKINRELYKRKFGKDMPTNEKGEISELMPSATLRQGDEAPKNIPFVMSKDGLDFKMANVMNEIGQVIYKNSRALRRIETGGDLNFKAWWVPPVNFAKKDIMYIKDLDTGKTVNVIGGDGLNDLRKKTAIELELRRANGENVSSMDETTMDTYQNSRDRVMDEMFDFSDPLAQTGTATGTQVGHRLISGEETLAGIQQSYQSILNSVIRRSRAVYFKPHIQQVRNLDAMQRVGKVDARFPDPPVTQRWLNLLYGNPTTNKAKGIGGLGAQVEDHLDVILSVIQSKLRGTQPGSINLRVSQAQEKFFNDYTKEMGANSPYENMTDFISRSTDYKTPWTAQKLFSEMNGLTTAMVLRVADIAHPLLNMTSLAATSPAVLRALVKPSELEAGKWNRDLAAFSTAIRPGGDERMFNPTRLLASAIHEIFNARINKQGLRTQDGSGRLVWEVAAEKGYLSQVVSEMLSTVVNPTQGYNRARMRKVVDKLSTLSDSSEELARGISWMQGYIVATKGYRMKSDKDAFMFAQKFADDVIGDYRPNNRPGMFQGTMGMPLGLFTTFMWNYNQRIVKYIEDKNVRALATQYLTQTALFGAQTVPGFSQYTEFFASNYDGSVNIVDNLYDSYGDVVTDAFLHGSLSTLPMFFGADQGLGLTSRGDASVRMIPTIGNITEAPAVQMVSKTLKAMGSIVSGMATSGISVRHILESFAQNSMSRPFKSAIELGLGTSIDHQGRVVTQDVYQNMNVVARVMGLKTTQEIKSTEAWYKMSSQRFQQASKRATLRDSVRAKIRGGDYLSNPENVADDLRTYIATGGTADGAAGWLADQVVNATVNRNTARLLEDFDNPRKLNDIKKLLRSMTDLQDSDFPK